MFKNVASQKVALFAFDITTGAAKTGDGANITPYVSKDYGTVTALGTATATEMSSTNAPGWYSFVLTQGETNGDALLFTAKSSTANVSLVGALIFTAPMTQIADTILDRDMSTGTDSGSTTVRTVRQALRFLRNKWAISTGTLTVYKEDDSTSSWTATVTTDGSALPIVSNDPAGP